MEYLHQHEFHLVIQISVRNAYDQQSVNLPEKKKKTVVLR